jgi:hypothetical protein
LAPIGQNDLTRILVLDTAGHNVLTQAIDTDGDYTADHVIFQADFGPAESKQFTVTAGAPQVYQREDFKAYGRFNRERFDDFCWENDRIAHRMYGKALETWEREPLTSSGVDNWVKRVSKLVMNDWYMMDNYHDDRGEGADLYSVGPTRGCGGNGLWAQNRLWLSKNFINSRVLACGPIRVMFELTYEPFDFNGTQVSEIKRISLDAGHNLDHFRSTYTIMSSDNKLPLATAVGINKARVTAHEAKPDDGTFTTWQPINNGASGNMGCATVVDPAAFESLTEDEHNFLVTLKAPRSNTIDYYAGFCWDKRGNFADSAAWKKFIAEFAQGLASPIAVTVTAQ